MSTAAPPAAEFSRPVEIDAIGDEPVEFKIVASDAERAALVRRFRLVDIPNLAAVVTLEWVRAHRVLRLSAKIEGEAVQNCVVSLDPVHEHIAEQVEIHFERRGRKTEARGRGTDEFDLEESEPLEGDVLDIGEVVAEEFVLSLNPYPRRPDAALGEVGTQGAAASPFEALASLKRNN